MVSRCNDLDYDSWLLAKFHRMPFSRSTSIATRPFDLVHMDLWGPYKTIDLYGTQYFLIVLDDYAQNTQTFLLQNKMQAP